MFVAQTRPPHLAAITPLSVIDDTYQTLYPGGIFNNGFALGWAKDRQADAQPRGQRWAAKRITAGDDVCKANQALRLQAPNVLSEIKDSAYYDRVRSDALAPATFVDKINVPVFLAGSWQDQETGSHFAEMLDDFAPGVAGEVHADERRARRRARPRGDLALGRVPRLLRRAPDPDHPADPACARATAALRSSSARRRRSSPTGSPNATDYASALTEYESEPPIRVLFDVGAGTVTAPGRAGPRVRGDAAVVAAARDDAHHAVLRRRRHVGRSTPDRRHRRRSIRLRPRGLPSAPTRRRNTPTPPAAPRSSTGSRCPQGKAVAYVSAPLAADTVMLGTGSVDLWLRSSAPDVDLEVTVSEVRPDGQETYVQSGWLRASRRSSTPPRPPRCIPVPTYRKRDVAPLPKGRLSLVRVPLYPFGHVFRAGSRIRIVVQPPGGNRPSWAFDTLRYGRGVTNEIARSAAHPSKVVLPVISGVDVPTPLPACGSLRGQPCRDYVAAANGAER